jgi:acyl-[acyl-carrier-protein]-phospholipid O-acyltransferase/long-chain-fatty-acid--[acyl-carrier-protein] ligase
MSSVSLLSSRRFGTMFTAMALGAFNDNFYKNALIIITTYSLAAQMGIEAATLLSIAGAAFIMPFFLCSGLAGEIADRIPKYRLVRALKITEFILILFASVALYFQHAWSLMTILFLLGVQAAFFGPVKYSILPELLKKEELLQGNAIIEAGTFLAILTGTLIGGLLILQPNGPMVVAASLIAASAVGLWAAYRIPVTTVTKPELVINYNIFTSTWRMVRHAFENPGLIYPILGISWFWAIGATYLTQLPVFTKEIIGADEKVVTLFNGIFTVGIALGSFFCPAAIKWFGTRAKYLSALALAGVFGFGLDVCFIGHHAPTPLPDELLGIVDYLTASEHHLRLAMDLFLLAFCGGVFIVPLYTQLQTASDEHERARTIASNNVMNALFIASASILAAGMFGYGFTVLQVLFVIALFNVPVIATLAYSARKKRA